MPRTAGRRVIVANSLRGTFAALARRVRALEDAIHPPKPRKPSVDSRAGERWQDSQTKARHKAIRAYYDRELRTFLREHPDAARRRQEEQDKLNAYLQKKGFEPETED